MGVVVVLLVRLLVLVLVVPVLDALALLAVPVQVALGVALVLRGVARNWGSAKDKMPPVREMCRSQQIVWDFIQIALTLELFAAPLETRMKLALLVRFNEPGMEFSRSVSSEQRIDSRKETETH